VAQPSRGTRPDQAQRADPLVSRLRAAGSELARPAVVASAAGTVAVAQGGAPASHVATAPLPHELDAVLASLRTPTIWLDEFDRVVRAHPDTIRMRLVRTGRVRVPAISNLVASARSTRQIVSGDVRLHRGNPRAADTLLRVRVTPMATGSALVLIEDLSEATRLDNVRRDFVANVSHELKTPVGAITLLAEAILDGRDDPELVGHFAARMQAEAQRLATLVSDLLDLSQLEVADPMANAEPVMVTELVAAACSDTAALAASRSISFVVGGAPDLVVRGVRAQLVAALRNLITNALNYSPEGTKVAITTTADDSVVSIAVTDQGIGIPRAELNRIFERFYRVDPARSRNTGGTGLGLAIVKHVCANHGGDCTVWSKPREGSTFTMRLPLAVAWQADPPNSRSSEEL
jgi:two-component system sensor histidine kinase SenX3